MISRILRSVGPDTFVVLTSDNGYHPPNYRTRPPHGERARGHDQSRRSPYLSSSFFFYSYADHRDLHSFPTRRSSDLGEPTGEPDVLGFRGVRHALRRHRAHTQLA